jgi:GDP-D-mannose 3',5'-epimerase
MILVTGAGGFIGGHLVKRLCDEGIDVFGVDIKPYEEWHQQHPRAYVRRLDLRNIEECRTAVAGCNQVYNLAADMGGMGFIESHKAECMLSVLINTHMLLAARDAGVERFFFSSSACVYNANLQTGKALALREEDAYPAMPEDGYGWEKLFSERMCSHFTEDFGLLTRVARYHNIYGPHGTWTGGREKAPAAICRKIAEAIRDGRDYIDVWGDGTQQRSFTYVDDCVEGTLRLMHSDRPSPMNIGSSEVVTINELIDIVEKHVGMWFDRRYQTDAPKGVQGRNSDNTRARAHLGWEPSTTLAQGIAQTYDWIDEQVNHG